MYKKQWAHTNWRTKDGRLNRLERRAHTYILASQGWVQRKGEVLSACDYSHSKESRYQQAGSVAMHDSHSPAKEPKIGAISWVKTWQGNTATHMLVSQVSMLSAGLKHMGLQPHTAWRAKDRCLSRVEKGITHCSHSLPKEWRTSVVSRLETQQGIAATHKLKDQGKKLSTGWKYCQAL